MKRLWLVCLWGLIAFALHAEINRKKVLEHPGFVTANTSEIEISKIVITGEQTQVDAVMYGEPGTPAVISSNTFLQAKGLAYRLREAGNVSVDGLTEPVRIPESGRLEVVLSFPPLPKEVHEVDFVEQETGWKIWGVQLSREEPYVYVPNFLQTAIPGEEEALPAPVLKAGKTVINGYVLGYDSRMQLEMKLGYADHIFPKEWSKAVTVRQDGSFHIEVDLPLACKARLQINRAGLDLLLLPGEELTVYVHLARLSMSASGVLGKKYAGVQKAWFDGAADALNARMAVSPDAVSVLKPYGQQLKQLLQTPEVEADIQKAAPLCSRLQEGEVLDNAGKKVLKSLESPVLKTYIAQKERALSMELARTESVKEAVVAQLDTTVTGADILPRIIAPHKGRAILIDFWATWCGPCKKSMVAMQPLKRMLEQKDVVYIYLTGPSSPKEVWKEDLKKMTGVHFRLTASQWEYLCKAYSITGIPGYLVISHDGKLQDRYVGFPGVDTLYKDLLRATEE